MKYEDLILSDLPTEYWPLNSDKAATTEFLLSGNFNQTTLFIPSDIQTLSLDINVQTITEDLTCLFGSENFGLFITKINGEKLLFKVGKKEINLPIDCHKWHHIELIAEANTYILKVDLEQKTLKAKPKSTDLLSIGYIGGGFSKVFIKNFNINSQSQKLTYLPIANHNIDYAQSCTIDTDHFFHFPTRANAPQQTGSFSIEFWYKNIEPGRIIKISTTDEQYKGFEIHSKEFETKVDFNHIVLTIEKSTKHSKTIVRKYLNGKKISKEMLPFVFDGIPSFGGEGRTDLVILGGEKSASFEIKDLAIYRSRLNKHQVRAHYHARIPEIIAASPKTPKPTLPLKYLMSARDSFEKNTALWWAHGTPDTKGELAGRNPANLSNIIILAIRPLTQA